jgi:hypothetical protein
LSVAPTATILPSGWTATAFRAVAAPGDVGRHDPVGIEGGDRVAVGAVAHDADVEVRQSGRVGKADRDEPSVREQRRVGGLVVVAAALDRTSR